MLDLFRSKMVLGQLVGLVFALLALAGIHVPSSVSPAATVDCLLLLLAAFTAFMRFGVTGAGPADAKVWWRSRTIWTAIVAAALALLGLAGVRLGDVDQAQLVAAIMTVTALINLRLHADTNTAIA